MKIFRMLLLVVLLTVSTNIPTFAAKNEIKVIAGGIEVVFADQQPIFKDGRILVPIRGVFELLVPEGSNKEEVFKVTWNEKTSTATIKNKWYKVTIKSGKKTFISNDKTITTDVMPQMINKKLMIPLRAVAEAVDAKVEWDGENNVVKIYYEPLVKVVESEKKGN